MRAAVFQGLGERLSLEDRPDPQPAAGEIVVAVGRCGICGSDLHMAEDPAFGACPGDIFGHEFAGEVVELGSDVSGVKTGELVSVVPLASCGNCRHCQRGEVQWCAEFGLQGGGYAEYAKTKPNQCVKLPDGVSLADGAIIEPLAVALHGVRLSGLQCGDKVLVLGAGPIGLAVAYWARQLGASKIAVQDIAPYQEARALEMGADSFLLAPDDPALAAAGALGGAPDIVFECVGVPGLIDQAVSQVRPRGTVLLLGLCTQPDSINSFAMLGKEVRLVTSAFFTLDDYRCALDALAAGDAEPRALVTSTVSIDAAPDAFEALKHRTNECKVLIAPERAVTR